MTTKKALQEHVRSRLSEWIIGSKTRTADDVEWVRQLLQKQESWKDRASRVSIVRSIKKRGCVYLQVKVDPCKRWYTVSWRASCGGSIAKCASPLFSALRNSIKGQVSRWKSSHLVDKCCARCQATTRLQADHVTAFIQIAREFVACRQSTTPVQFDCRACKGFFFQKSDVAYARSFRAYHKSHATFQWLCKSCNCSKGAKGGAAECILEPIVATSERLMSHASISCDSSHDVVNDAKAP